MVAYTTRVAVIKTGSFVTVTSAIACLVVGVGWVFAWLVGFALSCVTTDPIERKDTAGVVCTVDSKLVVMAVATAEIALLVSVATFTPQLVEVMYTVEVTVEEYSLSSW